MRQYAYNILPASVSDILTAVEKKDFDTAFRLITTADREKIEALKRVLGSDEELKNYLSMIELGYLSSKLSEAKSWKDVVNILSPAPTLVNRSSRVLASSGFTAVDALDKKYANAEALRS